LYAELRAPRKEIRLVLLSSYIVLAACILQVRTIQSVSCAILDHLLGHLLDHAFTAGETHLIRGDAERAQARMTPLRVVKRRTGAAAGSRRGPQAR
jgi:hypothetical protein